MRTRPHWPAALVTATGAAGAACAAGLVGGGWVFVQRWHALWWLLPWTAAWLAGVAAARRLGPGRASMALVLGVGLAVRAAALTGPPALSDDLYRYAWDARVQAAGTDPYQHAPEHPALIPLRERWLWPAGCDGCTRLNRPAAPTIYPPVAEVWFTGVSAVSGGVAHRHKTWQVAGLACDAAVMALIVRALRRSGREPLGVAWYALCPLPAIEWVNSAHVDSLAVVAVLAAVLAAHRSRRAGLLLGAAAAVKLYPALLVLGLRGRGRRLVDRAAVAWAVGLFALVYAPHVLAAGPKVLGYLPGYLQEEHYDAGGRFLLAGAVGIHGVPAAAVTGAAFLAAVVQILRRRLAPVDAMTLLLGALLLAATPVQPWYALALGALAVAAGRPWWLAVAFSGEPYYLAVILHHPHAAGIGELAYAGAAAIALSGEWRAARQPDQSNATVRSSSSRTTPRLAANAANTASWVTGSMPSTPSSPAS